MVEEERYLHKSMGETHKEFGDAVGLVEHCDEAQSNWLSFYFFHGDHCALLKSRLLGPDNCSSSRFVI